MKATIAQIILGLAEYYNHTVNKNQLAMYVEDLIDLSPEQLELAVKKYRVNPDHKFFPLPAALRGEVAPHIDAIDEARDIANIIIASVSRFGHTNQVEAQNHIGELGWTVITRMGGWKNLCETLTLQNESMFRAQIRDYAMTVQKKATLGELEIRPAIRGPKTDVAALIAGSMKDLE